MAMAAWPPAHSGSMQPRLGVGNGRCLEYRVLTEDELKSDYKKMCLDELQKLTENSDENLVTRVHRVRNSLLDTIYSADKSHSNDDEDMEKVVVVFNIIEDYADEFSQRGNNPDFDGFVEKISPLIENLRHKFKM
jgi:hypothetical protein